MASIARASASLLGLAIAALALPLLGRWPVPCGWTQRLHRPPCVLLGIVFPGIYDALGGNELEGVLLFTTIGVVGASRSKRADDPMPIVLQPSDTAD